MKEKIINLKPNDTLVVDFDITLINLDSLKIYKQDPNHIIPLRKNDLGYKVHVTKLERKSSNAAKHSNFYE